MPKGYCLDFKNHKEALEQDLENTPMRIVRYIFIIQQLSIKDNRLIMRKGETHCCLKPYEICNLTMDDLTIMKEKAMREAQNNSLGRYVTYTDEQGKKEDDFEVLYCREIRCFFMSFLYKILQEEDNSIEKEYLSK